MNTTTKNLLDSDVPDINVPLLKPKNVFKWLLLDTPNPYFNETSLLKLSKYVSKIKSLIEKSKEK